MYSENISACSNCLMDNHHDPVLECCVDTVETCNTGAEMRGLTRKQEPNPESLEDLSLICTLETNQKRITRIKQELKSPGSGTVKDSLESKVNSGAP